MGYLISSIRKFLLRKLRQAICFFFNLLCLPFSFLLYLLGFRIFGLKHFHAIGHLAIEPDTYLKLVALKQARRYRMLLLAPTRRITSKFPNYITCNEKLLDYWKSEFYVIKSPWLFLLLTQLKCWKKLRYPIDHYVMNQHEYSLIFRINKEYQGSPMFRLTQEHKEQGKEILQKLGVPQAAWFVCFHSRAHDFAPAHLDQCFSCRNADINSLYLGVEAVIRSGGWALRMGHPNAPALDSRFNELTHVVDYTKSKYVSDEMDLFLAAHCKFFIGGPTGLSKVPFILGTPSVLVNQIPFTYLPFSPSDLSIPKLYFSKAHQRLLTFSEILALRVSSAIHNSDFEAEGIELINNTEEEIHDVILEMLKRFQGEMSYTREQKELHQKFAALLQPNHFCFDFGSSVGIAFLEKYQHLIT